MTRPIEADDFAISVEDILNKVEYGSNDVMPAVIQKGVRKSASLWREKASEYWPKGSEGHTYRKHGKTYQTGKYVKSIRSHMIQKDGPRPSGEAGSPKMPGLAHLLENGHAEVGGGRTRAFPHVKKAAEESFTYVMNLVGDEMERMLDDI